MAVGDSVVLRFTDARGQADILRGVVNAEPGADAQVLWENGELSTVPQARLEQDAGAPDDVDALLGQWLQLRGLPLATTGAPKSPAASGVAVQVFGLSQYGADDPNTFLALIATEDGRRILIDVRYDADTAQFIDPPFVAQPTRRSV